MKKYRPTKLYMILLALIAVGILSSAFLLEGWSRVAVLVCTGIMVISFILVMTYYVQFQADRIVIRHGLSSSNKTYSSNFKTVYILHSDINSLSINHLNTYVIIGLKNGNSIMFSFGGYLKKNQIINEFEKINNELKDK